MWTPSVQIDKPANPAGNLLARVLADPLRAASLDTGRWDLLLRMARRAKVLPRLGYVLEDHGLAPGHVPDAAWTMLRAARAYPDFVQVRCAWELRRVLAATEHLGTELILLKGGAYLHAGLAVSRGRGLSDLDLMVRREALEGFEQALLEAGWEHQKLDAYDQRYYREWMHEIPPLSHPERGMEVDIHHRLLPLTSRLNPDPELLWQAAVPLGPRVRVLAPADMVLHSATHLFYDGDLADGFKQLLDLHLLLVDFGSSTGFWEGLPERARQLELEGPLRHALHFCRELLETPIPDFVVERCRGGPGARLVRALEGQPMRRVLTPAHPEAPGVPLSAWLLYVRSHWLRMPPGLLAKHLMRKWLRRRGGE